MTPETSGWSWDTTIQCVIAITTIIGFSVALVQLRGSRKIAKGEFLLRLDELFQQHQLVHRRLRPGGDWSEGGAPKTAEEWASIESYMGLFERINVLIDDGVIDIGTFRRLYGYRVSNILNNPTIVSEKLENEKESWQDFIQLVEKLKNENSSSE